MRVLVTGASGFIGRALVRSLAARGDRLVVLLRQPGSAGDLPAGAERAQWDASAPPAASTVAGVEAVVHLAGETIARRWTPARKDRIRASRIDGTRHLVDALLVQSPAPRVLVAASAVGYYGDRGDEVLTENATPGADFLANVCRDWEREAARAAAAGTRVVHLRTGVVLDRDGGALARLLPPFRLGLGGRIGNGRQWMSWIHRDDAVGSILHAIDDGDVRGPVNLTAPEPVRNADLTRCLASVLERPAILPVPAAALRLVLGEAAGMLLASQRAVPERLRDSGYDFRFASVEPALRAILRR